MKSVFYIDGFNLYNKALAPAPELKWLNLAALADLLNKDGEVAKINYYTAKVSGKIDPGHVTRQNAYLRALKTELRIEAHVSKFQKNMVWAFPAQNYETKPEGYEWAEPKPALIRVEFSQEKDSDVALASHLLRDAALKRFDKFYVLSGDSDFAEAIRIAVQDFGAEVELILPSRPRRRGNPGVATKLLEAASAYSYLGAKFVAAAQFPDKILKPGQDGQFLRRPEEWD